MALPKITRHIGIVFFKYNEDYNCPIFRDSKLAVLEHCPRNLIQVFPLRFFATKSANGFKLTSNLFSLSHTHYTLDQQLCIHSKVF